MKFLFINAKYCNLSDGISRKTMNMVEKRGLHEFVCIISWFTQSDLKLHHKCSMLFQTFI